MQNFSKTETRGKLAFESKLEDVPGGVTVAVSDLTQAVVKAGTPIGLDQNGLAHVVKVARLQADVTNTATAYPVLKGHNFKVGDFLTAKTLGKAYAITSINTSNPNYDTLNVGTTLGIALTAASGATLMEASAQATGDTSTLKFEPLGLTGHDFDVLAGDNHLVDCVVRGSVKENNIDPVSADIKEKLPLIRFVKN